MKKIVNSLIKQSRNRKVIFAILIFILLLLFFATSYKSPVYFDDREIQVTVDLPAGDNVSVTTQTSFGQIGINYSADSENSIEVVFDNEVTVNSFEGVVINKLMFNQSPAKQESFIVNYQDSRYLCKVNRLNDKASECSIDMNSVTNNSNYYLFGLDVMLRLIDYYYIYLIVVIAYLVAKKIT